MLCPSKECSEQVTWENVRLNTMRVRQIRGRMEFAAEHVCGTEVVLRSGRFFVSEIVSDNQAAYILGKMPDAFGPDQGTRWVDVPAEAYQGMRDAMRARELKEMTA